MTAAFYTRSIGPAAILLFLVAAAGCSQQKVGAVLTYQAAPAAEAETGDDPAEAAKRVVEVLSRRFEGIGRVQALPDGNVSVEVLGDVDDLRLDLARRLATTAGRLQFRIMASPRISDHQEIIAASAASPPTENALEIDGALAAQWFDCAPREFPDEAAAAQRGLATRESNGRLQALALMNDELDVSGDFLTAASADVDETGRPQLSFEFDAEGALLFGQLTGQHLPRADGVRYMLGIILDDVLLSAPTIESKITNRGRISGNMTQAEVDAILPVFRAGTLPCELREVSVTRGEE